MIFLNSGGHARLGLDHSATERDIKRAYARELKLINPAVQAREFAELRGAYENALAFAKFQAELGSDFEGGEEADAQHPLPEGTGESPNPAHEPGAGPKSTDDPAGAWDAGDKEGQWAPSPTFQPFNVTRFEAFFESLDFSPPDQPAAKAALLHWLAGADLMPMAARDVFELELLLAISDRRFGPRNAAMLLAAADVFGWNDARHQQLEQMGAAGAYVSNALADMVTFSEPALQRWLALTEVPNSKKALELIKPGERMETASPILAGLFFADGHIEAWKLAHAQAPMSLRAAHRVSRWVGGSVLVRGLLLLLLIPLALALMSAMWSRINKSVVPAAVECDSPSASGRGAPGQALNRGSTQNPGDCVQKVRPTV